MIPMFLSCYAQARGCEALDGDIGFGKSCGRAHPAPIIRDECAGNGYGPVVLHKWMQVCDLGEGFEKPIRDRGAGEVVYEPAGPRAAFHPRKEVNDLRFAEVVGEKRADNDVYGSLILITEDVDGDPSDSACRRGGFGRDGDGVGIQIASGQFDRHIALVGPLLDFSQSVTVAASHVKDVYGAGIRRQVQ